IGATEQIVDRLFRHLAGDVPQRLLDAGGGAVEFERAAPLRVVVERDLQDVADVERIATDEIAAELVDLRGHSRVAGVLAIGLAPADHAGVGLDPHEHEILPPAGMDRKTFDGRDFHNASDWSIFRKSGSRFSGSKMRPRKTLVRTVTLDRHPAAGARLRVV